MSSFWQSLPKPFFVMAPMADVTDPAFRRLVARCGAPDVFWTEFISADGLYHTREVQRIKDEVNPLVRDFGKSDAEHPIVAQIFSSNPENIAYAVRFVSERGYDGVDINMGCPDRSIERQGCGSAMIKTPDIAREIIRSAQNASALPVSVKTRLGYNEESLASWLPELLAENPSAITLHLRTRKEMSNVPAHWDLMEKAVAIRDRINPTVLLIGNGDVTDLEDAKEKVRTTRADGVMLGRAMFGNPWVFAGRKPEDTSLSEKLGALLEFAQNFEKLTPPKHFAILKKHFKAFVTGFDGASELRAKMMLASNTRELQNIVKEFQLY